MVGLIRSVAQPCVSCLKQRRHRTDRDRPKKHGPVDEANGQRRRRLAVERFGQAEERDDEGIGRRGRKQQRADPRHQQQLDETEAELDREPVRTVPRRPPVGDAEEQKRQRHDDADRNVEERRFSAA